MKIGIKKIESIPTSKVKNWGFVEKNAEIKLSPFIDGSFSEIQFTEGTATLQEEWIENPAGLYSETAVNSSVRLKAKEMEPVLSSLMISENIYRITTLNNDKFVIGSIDFKPKLTYKREISGISSSEIIFTITCKSLHGLIRQTEL